jgi:hypothetical protein
MSKRKRKQLVHETRLDSYVRYYRGLRKPPLPMDEGDAIRATLRHVLSVEFRIASLKWDVAASHPNPEPKEPKP